MFKTNKILHKHIPKRVLKLRSRCRRKLYRLTEVVERILLSTQDKKYLHKQERLKVKTNVHLYLSEQLGTTVKKIQFKTMSNKQCIYLEQLLDETTPAAVIEWIKLQAEK